MGKKDTITKEYLSRPDIFADAFNYFLFGGKKVIKPTDLQEQDPTELAIIKKMGKSLLTRRCGMYLSYALSATANMQP